MCTETVHSFPGRTEARATQDQKEGEMEREEKGENEKRNHDDED